MNKRIRIKSNWIFWQGGYPWVIDSVLAKTLLKSGYAWKYAKNEIAANKSHPKTNSHIEELRKVL